MGAILAGAPASTVEALAEFGRHLGIAFQAIDDVLGVWGEPAVTGKPVGNDLRQHKKTLPVALALARGGEAADALARLLEAETWARRRSKRATALLEECGAREETMAIGRVAASCGPRRTRAGSALSSGRRAELAAIARYVTERDR